MNAQQKQQVLALRGNGETCAKIADKLGISVNTVKSFCRRNIGNVKTEASIETKTETAVEIVSGNEVCPQCGSTIVQIKGRKPKRFCSDDCRAKWWNSHSDSVNQKALYSFECAFCNKAFSAYGNSKRRYCSHSCYCASRYNKAVTL